MLDTRKVFIELYVAEQLERVRAGTDRTQEMLRQSREQIAKSTDLLRTIEVPRVWHPEPPTE